MRTSNSSVHSRHCDVRLAIRTLKALYEKMDITPTSNPAPVAMSASEMPAATTANPPEPVAAMFSNARTIPMTVPSRPMNGARLPMVPINLAINTPASEPYQISYRLVGDGFEVRAVDKEGRPFTLKGRDVVLTHKPVDGL